MIILIELTGSLARMPLLLSFYLKAIIISFVYGKKVTHFWTGFYVVGTRYHWMIRAAVNHYSVTYWLYTNCDELYTERNSLGGLNFEDDTIQAQRYGPTLE